MSYQRQKESW